MIVPINLKAKIYRADILGQIIVPVSNRFTYLSNFSVYNDPICVKKTKHLQDSVKEELQKQQPLYLC